MADDHVFGAVDDGWERAEAGWDRAVAVGEKSGVAADGIVCKGHIECFLDVGALGGTLVKARDMDERFSR